MLASLELQPEPERENPSGSGSAEQPSNESHEQRQEEAAEPWLLPQFQTIQRSSKDQWNFTLWDQGWAIREHRKHRVRAFHPVHSSTPFDCAILDSERVTRKVCPREEIVTDQWTAANTWRGEAWMGYTFFRLSAECEGFEVIRPWAREFSLPRKRGCAGVQVQWHAQIMRSISIQFWRPLLIKLMEKGTAVPQPGIPSYVGHLISLIRGLIESSQFPMSEPNDWSIGTIAQAASGLHLLLRRDDE